MGVGVYIFSGNASGNVLQGNYIGTNSDGTSAITGSVSSVIGVLINAASGNVLQNNVISGNQVIGIEIAATTASGNVVQDNVIGTNKFGTAAIPNGADGIFLNGAPGNTIGGATKGDGNVVSGNGQVGIQIFGLGAHGNLIQNNTLGRTASVTVRPGLLNGDSNDLGIYVNTTPNVNTIVANIGQGLRESPTGAPFIPSDPGSAKGATAEVRRGEHARPFAHRPFLRARSRPAYKAGQARNDDTHRVTAAR
jgi:parallel beta-helix repeat protein